MRSRGPSVFACQTVRRDDTPRVERLAVDEYNFRARIPTEFRADPRVNPARATRETHRERDFTSVADIARAR